MTGCSTTKQVVGVGAFLICTTFFLNIYEELPGPTFPPLSAEQAFNHMEIVQYSTNCAYIKRNATQRMTSQSRDMTSKPWGCDVKNKACSKALDLDIPHNFIDRFINPCWYGNNSRLNCLPYYFLAGFPKCGTTDLHFKIVLHPNIIKPNNKECHFWTRKRFFKLNCKYFSCARKEKWPFESYLTNFRPVCDCIEALDNAYNFSATEPLPIITGESSPSTFWHNPIWASLPGNENLAEPRVLVAHHMRYYLPRVKVIVILRNPVDRLFSEYLYFRDESKSAQDFHTKVQKYVDDFEHCRENRSLRTCVYNSQLNHENVRLCLGMYSVFIKDWLKIYPRDQLHTLRTDYLATEPVTQLNRIFQFLGLDSLPPDVAEKIEKMPKKNTRRKGTASVVMFPKTRTLLSQFYRPFNEDLAKITKDKNYLWRDS